MKRYWKLSLLVLMIIVSLTTLYTQQAFSMSGLPQFTFKTLQGNPNELSSIDVSASYSSTAYSYTLKIDQNGTHYHTLNFLWMSTPGPSEYKKLITQYHHFMRGKGSILSYYYEDSQDLIYATVDANGATSNVPHTSTLHASVLDKKTREETNLSFPVKTVAYYFTVYDVERVGNLLKVVAQGQLVQGGSEVHVLTVDLKKQAVIKDETINQTLPPTSSLNENVSVISNTAPLKPNRWIILLRQNGNAITVKKTLKTYNLISGLESTLSLPKSIPSTADVMSLEGDTLYLSQQTSSGKTFYAYNIESGQVVNSFHVNLPSPQKKQPPVPTEVGHGRVYVEIPSTKGQGITLIIRDLQSGKTLYKGQLVKKGGSRPQGKLQINGIDFK